MSIDHQVTYRDAFLGGIQNKGRQLQQIRFPLVVTVNHAAVIACLSAVPDVLQSVYCDRGTINIIAQSDTKLMLIFTDDQDALLAYQDLQDKSIQDHRGSVISFKVWHPLDDLGYDIADHHIYIAIKGLPQHLWKEEVVEQILHPYCALDTLSDETSKRMNLSLYTCFGWSQQRIKMPKKISLKVVQKGHCEILCGDRNNHREFSVYTLLIEAVGYICDPTTHCSCNLNNLNRRYESGYDPDSAQCYLTTLPDNQNLLDELKFGVIATTLKEDHGCQREEIQDLISTFIPSQVKVHMLTGAMFMILPLEGPEGKNAQETLLEMKTLHFGSVHFTLDKWKIETAATTETLSTKVSVTVNEIPSHLCTFKVIEFLLSPYCAVDDNVNCDQTSAASEHYTVTAWTKSPYCIPNRIMAAIFSMTTAKKISEYDSSTANLRITQLLIDTSIQQIMSVPPGVSSGCLSRLKITS